jgi:hypothetical protein
MTSDFSEQPRDPALGAFLREALDEGATPFLATRLRAQVRARSHDAWLDVLARWLRIPVAAGAAAVTLALAAALWWTLDSEDSTDLTAGASVEQALLADNSPAQDIVLARFMEGR